MFRRSLVIAVLATSAVFALHSSLWVLAVDPEVRVQYVPDDAFYYLTLARSYATSGEWTFDGGVSRTTGFHLLHAYVLAGLFAAVEPGVEQFPQLAIVVTALVASAAAIGGAVAVWRSSSVFPAGMLGIVLMSRNVRLNMISGTEWSWVVGIAALYALSLVRVPEGTRWWVSPTVFLLGLAGVMARSEFLLFAVATAVASVVERAMMRSGYRVGPALIGFAGAAAGAVGILVHGLVVSGELLQSSARMKLSWLATEGPSLHPILDKVLWLFGAPSDLTAWTVAILAALIGAIGFRAYFRPARGQQRRILTSRDETVPAHRMLWLASVLTIAGYLGLYSLVPMGVQHWYTATMVVPLLLFFGLPFVGCHVDGLAKKGAYTLLALIGALQLQPALAFDRVAEWPHQVAMYRAGRVLHGLAASARVGSWNAGILGYYSGGNVINLDGLVNSEVHQWIAADDLEGYVDAQSIDFVLDFEYMLTQPSRQRRGGYSDGRLAERLVPLLTFNSPTAPDRRLTLFRVVPLGPVDRS